MLNIRLLKKLAMLAVLLGAFGYLSFFDSQVVSALPCCRDCIAEDEACTYDCFVYYTGLPYEDEEGMNQCYAWCGQMRNACSVIPCNHSCHSDCPVYGGCGPGDCYCNGTYCTCIP